MNGVRWGIKGADWRDVRPIPLGEHVARGWCRNLSAPGPNPVEMTLYRDSGDGWQPVEVFWLTVARFVGAAR